VFWWFKVAVNANSVVRSSFMLVGVGCEGKLRFVMKGIVLLNLRFQACNFSISSQQDFLGGQNHFSIKPENVHFWCFTQIPQAFCHR
jgi:hypothetical protein